MPRTTQPYKRRSPFRRQGGALSAMLRGRTAFQKNPMDATRRMRKSSAAGRRRRRKRPSVLR